MRKIDYINKISKEQIPTPKQIYEEERKRQMKKRREQEPGKRALFEAKEKLMEEKGWNRVNPMGDEGWYSEDRWDVKDVVRTIHKGIAESDPVTAAHRKIKRKKPSTPKWSVIKNKYKEGE